MLYTREQINSFRNSPGVASDAFLKYNKLFCEDYRSFCKLKYHEKDFYFSFAQCLVDDKGRHHFVLRRIKDAWEFDFLFIILTYSGRIIDFEHALYNRRNQPITPQERRIDRRYFNQYMQKWKNMLSKSDNIFTATLKPIIRMKIKAWRELCDNGTISDSYFALKVDYIFATLFHIYHTVKTYFDAIGKNYTFEVIDGLTVVFSVYSYCHILSRHYYPNLNQDIGVDLNPEIDVLDIDNLSVGVFRLIRSVSMINRLTSLTEYLLFEIDGVRYIMWLNYKRLSELKNTMGMEIRSFYKCTQENDLQKFEGKTKCELFTNHYAFV